MRNRKVKVLTQSHTLGKLQSKDVIQSTGPGTVLSTTAPRRPWVHSPAPPQTQAVAWIVARGFLSDSVSQKEPESEQSGLGEGGQLQSPKKLRHSRKSEWEEAQEQQ